MPGLGSEPGDPRFPRFENARDRALAYLSSWTRQRAVEDAAVPGLGAVLGSAGLRTLSRRMTRRMARSVPRRTRLVA